MIWDSCLVRVLAGELNSKLAGARTRAFHFDRDTTRVLVYLRESTLIVDLSGTGGWIAVNGPTDPDPSADPLPAKITSVEAPPDERLLFVHFRRVRGRRPDPTLILELATNRWNGLWTEGDKLKVSKRLRADERRPQPVGQPWEAPRGEARAGIGGTLTSDEWALLLAVDPEEEMRRTLLRTVAHVSSLNVGVLLPPAPPDEAHRRWLEMARLEALDPQVLDLPSGPQPYPWPRPGTPSTSVPTLLKAFAHVAESRASATNWVERYLAREARRLERRRRRLEVELDKAAGAQDLRDRGNLILASLHLIPPGSAEVRVPGFDGAPQTLKLDPRIKPQAHAETLFRRATRLERATRELPPELDKTEDSLRALADLRARHEVGELTDAELDRIRAAQAGDSGDRQRKSAPAEPYRRYRSSGGLEIRVGRDSRRNDELTFHHSRPSDVWLHAQHAAGSHVILRWASSDRPPARDLEEAATLAAWFSKARGSAHVPVVWTRRKHVRKPRGARPGSVVPEQVRTLFVSPDPALANRLMDE